MSLYHQDSVLIQAAILLESGVLIHQNARFPMCHVFTTGHYDSNSYDE
ncbi:hypothetical protein [Aureibaculum algae]|nr:hypothetical protein [Aureibaculum algae]